MKRIAGPFALALEAALPIAAHPSLWRLFAALGIVAVALAAAAMALRAARLVVWALMLVCVEALVALAAHGGPAHAWSLGLALVLPLGAEWSYAGIRDGHGAGQSAAAGWAYAVAAFATLGIWLLPTLPTVGPTVPLLGAAAIAVLVILLAVLSLRTPGEGGGTAA